MVDRVTLPAVEHHRPGSGHVDEGTWNVGGGVQLRGAQVHAGRHRRRCVPGDDRSGLVQCHRHRGGGVVVIGDLTVGVKLTVSTWVPAFSTVPSEGE